MKLTYVDAGVLITAYRGTAKWAKRAMEILDDPERSYASSIFVKLELLPKAIYHKKTDEAQFYSAFFDQVSCWASPDQQLLEDAFREAMRTGLSAIDALHVSCAASLQADELVTTEAETKPLHRTKRIKIVTIAPLAMR